MNIMNATHFITARNPTLTQWGWDKMAAIFQTTLSNAFLEYKFLYLDANFIEISSSAFNWQ